MSQIFWDAIGNLIGNLIDLLFLIKKRFDISSDILFEHCKIYGHRLVICKFCEISMMVIFNLWHRWFKYFREHQSWDLWRLYLLSRSFLALSDTLNKFLTLAEIIMRFYRSILDLWFHHNSNSICWIVGESLSEWSWFS